MLGRGARELVRRRQMDEPVAVIVGRAGVAAAAHGFAPCRVGKDLVDDVLAGRWHECSVTRKRRALARLYAVCRPVPTLPQLAPGVMCPYASVSRRPRNRWQ